MRPEIKKVYDLSPVDGVKMCLAEVAARPKHIIITLLVGLGQKRS